MSRWHQFLHAEGRIALLSNLGWSGANQAVRAAALALATVLVTRHLGPSAFGALALSLGIVKIAVVVAGLGLDRVVVRELVLHPAASGAVLRRSFLLKLSSGLAIYLATCACVQVFLPGEDLIRFLVAIAGAAIVFQAFDTFDFVFQAKGLMKLSFVGRTVPVLAGATLKVAAVLFGGTVVTFALLEAVEVALIGAGLVLVYLLFARWKREAGTERPREGTLRMLRDGLPLSIVAVAIIVYVRSDVIMLGAMVHDTAAGLYAAAAQVSEFWGIVPMAVAPALYPALLRIRETDRDKYRKRFELLVQGMTALGCVIAIGVTVLAPHFVTLLYGEAFGEAANVLRVHVWSVIFVFLGTTQSLWEAGERLFWATCVRTVLGAVCNIGLNLALIPLYGPVGAAVATLVSYAFAAFLLNGAMLRTRPLFWLQARSLLLLPFAAWLWNKGSVQHPEPGVL